MCWLINSLVSNQFSLKWAMQSWHEFRGLIRVNNFSVNFGNESFFRAVTWRNDFARLKRNRAGNWTQEGKRRGWKKCLKGKLILKKNKCLQKCFSLLFFYVVEALLSRNVKARKKIYAFFMQQLFYVLQSARERKTLDTLPNIKKRKRNLSDKKASLRFAKRLQRRKPQIFRLFKIPHQAKEENFFYVDVDNFNFCLISNLNHISNFFIRNLIMQEYELPLKTKKKIKETGEKPGKQDCENL